MEIVVEKSTEKSNENSKKDDDAWWEKNICFYCGVFMLALFVIVNICSIVVISKSECRDIIRVDTDMHFLVAFVFLSDVCMFFYFLSYLGYFFSAFDNNRRIYFCAIIMSIITGVMSCVVLNFNELHKNFYACNTMFISSVVVAIVHLIIFCVLILIGLRIKCMKLNVDIK